MVCFPNTFDLISWPSVTLMSIFLVTVGLVIWSLHSAPNVIIVPKESVEQPPVRVNVQTGDGRYSRAPEAERFWYAPPDTSRIPTTGFNIPTQGVPESYQSMGIVKTPEGKLLPLYGRRSISSRDRYNYYTRTDTYNPVAVPIHIKGRDCQDQVGCPELYNGDTVKLSATGEQGEVTIYRVSDIVR
jgi:hypothetical protein